jgi:hypothetical protein
MHTIAAAAGSWLESVERPRQSQHDVKGTLGRIKYHESIRTTSGRVARVTTLPDQGAPGMSDTRGAVRIVTMNRPQALNAGNEELTM